MNLVYSIRNGDLEGFRDGFRSLKTPTRRSEGLTLLHLAAKYLRIDIVSFLLAEGFPPDHLDKNRNTTLLFLLHFKKENHEARNQIIRLLLENGADPGYKKSKGGYSLLHDVIIDGDLDAAELLIAHRADVNEANNSYGFSPAFFAKDTESLAFLQSKGADLDHRARKQETILSYVVLVQPESLEMIRFLQPFSTTIQEELPAALETAIQKGRTGIADLLRDFEQSES